MSITRNAIRKRFKRLVGKLMGQGFSEKGARRNIAKGRYGDSHVHNLAREVSRRNARA